MNYYQIVNLVFQIIFTLYGLMCVLFVIFGLVGFFKKKRYPQVEEKASYGIAIPARNEAGVIDKLIESIHNTDYPQDKLHIFVIAHNCTDNTAEVARKLKKEGFAEITVYEYSNPNECTKGYGLHYLFEQIDKDFGIQSLDGYFIMDSDNIVAKNYFQKMNDAFCYYGKKNIIASYRNSKNFGKNLISGLYGIYFLFGCYFESRGRTVLGCSTRVSGTGYVISSESLKDGWNYLTLTEDWELTADQIIEGKKIYYCEDAIFYDEQPTKFWVMWRQRVRWSKGHLLVFLYRFKDIFKSMCKKGSHHISLYDILVNILPVILVFFFLTLLQPVLLALGPVFTGQTNNASEILHNVFLGYNQAKPFWWNMTLNNDLGWLIGYAKTFVLSYIGMVVLGVFVFIFGRKRIKHVNIFMKVLIMILWPLFLDIQFIIDTAALFARNLGWKTIPHDDQTSIDKMNNLGNEQ